MFGRKDLSVRTDRITLEPSQDAGWADLLFAEGEQDGWRIVELSSANGRPFDAELSWSAANGAGSKALITVARAGRVCIYGRTVSIRARNLHFLPNAVGVTVADGFAHTQNQLEVRGEGSASGPHAIRIPAFARSVRIETYDPDDTSGVLWIIDGDNLPGSPGRPRRTRGAARTRVDRFLDGDDSLPAASAEHLRVAELVLDVAGAGCAESIECSGRCGPSRQRDGDPDAREAYGRLAMQVITYAGPGGAVVPLAPAIARRGMGRRFEWEASEAQLHQVAAMFNAKAVVAPVVAVGAGDLLFF